MVNNVQVPFSYFVKSAQRDYNNATTAFLREFLQNSVDAGAKNIDIKIFINSEGKTIFECRDDGCGMDEDTIRNKLLVLGETSKSEGQTGGFGVAKILIYFCHSHYAIYTRNLQVFGSGGSYEINRQDSFNIKGCHAVVTVNRDVIGRHYYSIEDLVSIFKSEIGQSYLPRINVTVNGEEVQADQKAGRKIMDLGEISIHKTNKVTSPYASIRVNGLHMFDLYIREQKFKLVLELKTYSVNAFTTNRDGFKGAISDKVGEALAQICADPSTSKLSKTNFYKGKTTRKSPISEKRLATLSEKINEKLEYAPFEEIQKEIENIVAQCGLVQEEAKEQVEKITDLVKNQIQIAKETGNRVELRVFDLEALLAHHVYIHTIGKYRKVPSAWEPSKFTEKQKTLLNLWGKIVGLVLRDAGHPDTKFNCGYLFDDGTEGDITLALYQKMSGHTDVFYLNPCSYGEQNFFPMAKERRQEVVMWLLALAIHEVTHFLGYDGHNSSFVGAEAGLKLKCFKRIDEYLSIGF